MSAGSGHPLRRWVSAGGGIGKEGQRLEVLKSGKGVKFLLLRVGEPRLRFVSPRVTVAQLVFVTSWVFIFLIPVLCSHFSWFALVLTPSFSPPHPHIPLPSHLSLPLWNVLSVCVAACARPPHMVPFHSCVDCAPPLQISEVSESPRPPQTFIYPPWPDSLLHPDFHFWSMHSSAERASELTLAGRGAWNRVFFGMAFVARPPGLSFHWECFLQSGGLAFGRGRAAPAGCAGLLLLLG